MNSLIKASIMDRKPLYPSFLFSLKRDSLVSVNNTLSYIKNHPEISHVLFDNANHKICRLGKPYDVDYNSGQALANIYALKFINGHL